MTPYARRQARRDAQQHRARVVQTTYTVLTYCVGGLAIMTTIMGIGVAVQLALPFVLP